jgi:predicted dehydrogenase
MSGRSTRREFLKQSALTGAGLWIAGCHGGMPVQPIRARSKPATDKLQIAVIGVAGQGGWNLGHVAGESIVALCDVDENRAAKAREQFPKAAFYTDFRRVFDNKDVEAVLIATPDHTHAPATLMALRSGRHVYCEKPLTHTVYEARLVAQTAAKNKLATQMGTQMHACANYRRAVEAIQSGAIGTVREAHAWADRVWSGGERPKDTPPVPEGLHWNLWLGPAPIRPYNPCYVPAYWRGWWDFGGGTLGDMGCHLVDLVFWALELRHPSTVEAEGPPVGDDSAPAWMIVRYEFAARGKLPAVNLTWYNGGKRPRYFEEGKLPQWGDGVLFVGEKGMLLCDYDRNLLLPEANFKDYKRSAPFIPDSVGHHREWIEACQTGSSTACNFDYAGALTETVLLGNVAYRTGRRIDWDAKTLKAANAPEADKFIKPVYQNGWKL